MLNPSLGGINMNKICIALAATVFSFATGATIVISSAAVSSIHFQGGIWM